MNVERFSAAIKAIYAAVAELEAQFPGRRFTPDGHMVGSIGEVLASHHYGIALYPLSREGHDGHIRGKQVQIKATQAKSIGLGSRPEHLLVLRIWKDGSFTEAFNGPGDPVWATVFDKKLPKNGQYQISLSKLQSIQSDIPMSARIRVKVPHASTPIGE